LVSSAMPGAEEAVIALRPVHWLPPCVTLFAGPFH